MILNFSELAANSVNGFNIEFDTLVFDDPSISAAKVGLLEGANIGFHFGGKTIFLIATVENITTLNVTFADGSKLVVGDNTTGADNDPKANIILGGVKDDQLIGLGGNDSLAGDDGDDNLSGRGGKDVLVGDDGKDLLDGGQGEDILKGGARADTLTGGDDSDRFEFSSPAESRATAAGHDTISDFTGNDGLRGNDRIIYLEAGTEQNYEESGNIHDPGFDGSKQTAEDFFLNSDGLKKYVFVQDFGLSYLFADLDNDFKAEFCVAFENVFLDDFEFGYILTTTGTNGSDSLQGGHSDDNMSGGGGNDEINGGGGDDTLDGGNGNDVIRGGDGSDAISGGAGRDILIGGNGRDELTGGLGRDSFTYLQAADSAGRQADVIAGFVQGEDIINLRAIDAVAGGPDNEAFTFIGTDPFGNVAGELRIIVGTTRSVAVGDVNGDGIADLRIVFDSPITLTAADFLL